MDTFFCTSALNATKCCEVSFSRYVPHFYCRSPLDLFFFTVFSLFMIYQTDTMMLTLGTRDIARLWICCGCFHLGYCHDSVLHDWLSSAVFFSNQVCFECIDIVFGIIIMRKEIQNTTAWNAAPNQWLSLHHALQMHVDTHCWTSVLTSIKPGELLLGTDYNEVLQIHTKIFRWQKKNLQRL